MTRSLHFHPSLEELAMIIVAETAGSLKRFLSNCGLKELALKMVMRVVLAFIMHRGRMSCSAASGSIASERIHRGELSRFMARPRWQKHDFNTPLVKMLLSKEPKGGRFLFIMDSTMVSQAGLKTENTYSTGNRQRRSIKKGYRYNKKKVVRKKVHNFTFGLLITPSGIRIPMQLPHFTKEYCQERGLKHRTTAESAAHMIRTLPLPVNADVVVIGDTAFDAKVVRDACEEKGYTWIGPVNAERVYEGPAGTRQKVRSRLKDWKSLALKTIKLRASTGKYAKYRRISKWRVGLKTKPRVYYAYQEKRTVRSVGKVLLVFSTVKPNLQTATADDVKILMTNALDMNVSELLDLYSIRWQVELFFKELKSTLGFAQYSFQCFDAVNAWVNIAITTVLFLEHERIQHMRDRRLSAEQRRWWESQRLHGLCHAFRQKSSEAELKYLSNRLKTSGGIAKLRQLIVSALPKEYQVAA
jgi:hypothetical protein